MLAVVAAMETEVSGILRAGRWRGNVVPGVRAWRSVPDQPGTTLLAISGVGRQAAIDTARQLLAHSRPAVIASVGFGGALSPELHPGDLVVATSLRTWPAVPSVGATHEPALHGAQNEQAIRPDVALTQMATGVAEANGLPHEQGTWLCVESAVCAVEEKRYLRRETGALAVEMESYWLAQVASEAGVPFFAVRAVLDTADRGLPAVVKSRGSEVAPLKVLAWTAQHPSSVPALISLGRAMVFARQSLTRCVLALMTEFARRPAPVLHASDG